MITIYLTCSWEFYPSLQLLGYFQLQLCQQWLVNLVFQLGGFYIRPFSCSPSTTSALPSAIRTLITPSGNAYKENLNLTLSSLAVNSSLPDFLFTSQAREPDVVYGLVQCTSGISSQDCQTCADSAVAKIIETCPNQKEASIYYGNCCCSAHTRISMVDVGINSMRQTCIPPQGKLSNGREIAVKRLSRKFGRGLGELRFSTEIKADENVRDGNRDTKIVVGVAPGRFYVHEDSQFRIIHRDLKASSISMEGLDTLDFVMLPSFS
ncbi:hypothetical protein RHMOL_Rhmol06G0220600 [Rhododendron molle]|uniref:Uncharacterized protein n=1 Tax=Rhododendron molle TaxID=49168 RepID=A0ACC0NFT9_RHOML|nr:hypothetical protein RHMOL_Rhmol06G0220600 [Rhododendron molle]